jgi:hypothetical protein
LLEEDLRKAEAARRRAEKEEFTRLLEEDMRKAQEAHRRAMEQEERQRQAERESMESKFPSRGGVFRLMNSTVIGSLSPVWRSATWTINRNSTTEQQYPNITSQPLANRSSPDLKNDTSCGYPGKKAIGASDFMGTRPTALPNSRMYPFPFPYEFHFPRLCQLNL